MKIFFISLGCDKNLVDSEHMSGILTNAGYEFTDDETQADIIIINSCCFINDAKEESIDTIFEMAEYKKTGKCKALVLAGCMAQRYNEEIKTEIPEIDICIGTTAIDSIADALNEFFRGKDKVRILNNVDLPSGFNAPRNLSAPVSYAYLKIAEGCDKHCTYCIIPKIRGKYRSVDMETLLDEAKGLAKNGIKELILVAQETTLYGVDLYGKKSLHILLQKLADIPGIQWIRILYCYPEEIYDELIDEIATEDKICKYLDIPVQHASDSILKKMGRHTTESGIRDIISKLRERIPDIVLRTTLISGFPGETKSDHQKNLDFVKEIEFDRLGVFTYSPEENTPAASMEGQIDEEVKEHRRDQIMELQQDVVFSKSPNYLGKIFVTMIEGRIPEEDAYMGRTYMDCPGVDSNIFVTSNKMFMTGDFVKVKVTGVNGYDLIGEAVD